jgi:hypothetical protein
MSPQEKIVPGVFTPLIFVRLILEVLIQDAESYQALLDRLHHMETLTAIQEGIASAARGEGKPAAQVFSEMQTKYGLHG